MKMELMEITPTQARNWLGNNINNRNMSKRRINIYAKQMVNDEWQVNGEAIKLTDKGILLDGQHRLQAIVQANKTIKSYVITGVGSDVFKTIDTGKGRGAADILAIAGFENATATAAAVKAYHNIMANYKVLEDNRSGRAMMSNQGILKFVQDTKNFAKNVKEAMQYKKFVKFVTPSNAGALYHLFSKVSAADAAQFFHEVNSGDGLKINRPSYILREKLISLTGHDEIDRRKSKWLIVLYTIMAWNAFRTKKTLERLPQIHKFNGYPEIL